MGSSQDQGRKTCVYCGKSMPAHLAQCPHCREMAPEVHLSPRTAQPRGVAQVRQGLLWMLLAVVLHYFVGGYSVWHLPIPATINPAVTLYLTNLLFLAGACLGIYGLVLRMRA